MVNKTRLEINFKNLLSKCEHMTQENASIKGNWKLEKYVEALEGMIVELRKSPSTPSEETMGEYAKRVAFLKGILQAEKLPSVMEKSAASQHLSPGPVSSNKQVIKEIQLQTSSRYNEQMKEELLGKKEDVRTRIQSNSGGTGDDIDAVLKYHQAMQDKAAEEMVYLARTLKENSLLARHIIKKDTQTLESSTVLAEKNVFKLKTESSRLEQHVKSCCSWWLWIALAIVCATFLFMVLFMKLFPKKQVH